VKLRKKLTRFETPFELVIFDLDKTLTRCNVSFAFGQFLYRRKKLSLFKMFRLVGAYLLQKWGLSSLQNLHALAFRLLFQGKKKSAITAFVSEFLSQLPSSFFQDTVIAKLRKHQKEQIPIWIQSSSPEFLVIPIAALCGVTKVSASVYGTDDTGRFSHIETIVDGSVKKNFFLHYIQECGIEREKVCFYTDSIQDLPLLESVGTPIVVYGDKKLMKIAQKSAWQIL